MINSNSSVGIKLTQTTFIRTFTLLFVLVIFNAIVPSHAQTLIPGLSTSTSTASDAATPETAETPEEIRNMVARLSDQEVRQLLLDRLDAVAVAQTASESTDSASNGVVAFFKMWGNGVVGSVLTAIRKLPIMFTGQYQSFVTFANERGSTGTQQVLGIFFLAIVLGYLAEWVVRKITRARASRIDDPIDTSSFKESFKLLSLRLCFELVGLVAFMIIAGLVIDQMARVADREYFSLVLFRLIVFPRIMLAVSRWLLAPNRPELRLVYADDWTAKYICKHILGLFVLIGLGPVVISFNHLNNIPPGVLHIGFWLAAAVHIYVIYIGWKTRDGMTQMLLGEHDDVTPMEKKIAHFYPYFFIGAIVVTWLIMQLIAHVGAFHILRNSPQTVTAIILLFIPAMDTLLRGLVAYAVPPMQGDGAVAERAYYSTKRSYLRIGRVIVFGFLIVILMNAWQLNLATMASNAAGVQVATNFIRLLVILSIGYLVWEIVTLLINRKLAAEDTAAEPTNDELGGEGGGTGASRLSTILPLLRFTVQTIIVTMTILIALSNIGINITPLLAGAGVIGIAVGFGAQTLVSDIVSGIFFLIDDAFRAGEYIEVDGTVGTVEKISIRSMQLRHHRGGIHTIPYGGIPKLTNYSRDWVMVKMKFTVPFDTDLKKVKKLFKQINLDVADLPQFKDDMLQPFKSQGALSVNDVGIVIGGKFMAKPGTQFMMRKELYMRIQKAFDENGLQFARKEVRVRVDGNDDDSLTKEQLETAAGAGAAAVDEKPDSAV